MATPVVLVHGWGGSFDRTWQRSGFVELLREAGRHVIGIDMLGHGSAPKPHEPEAYTDLEARVAAELPPEPVDAIGFSLGAITLLRLAIADADHFHRLVLAGIGRNVLEPDPESAARMLSGVEGTADESDTLAHVFGQYAHQPGNDPVALAALLRRPSTPPPTAAQLGRVTCPTLVIIGDRDFAGPGEPLATAMPNARLITLRNVDHFATPESFGFIDAALQFIDAVPA